MTTDAPTEMQTGSGPGWYDADDLKWAARHWATRIGVRVGEIHLRSMTTKWASLSRSGRLTLNSELLELPRELGEYAIVHELVHLLVPNHGKVFKGFLYAYLPEWEQRARELQSFAAGRGGSRTRPAGDAAHAGDKSPGRAVGRTGRVRDPPPRRDAAVRSHQASTTRRESP
jgi:hypothetical protein